VEEIIINKQITIIQDQAQEEIIIIPMEDLQVVEQILEVDLIKLLELVKVPVDLEMEQDQAKERDKG
jgi:hypothetical protein